jgi:isoleucyl-tRNA synthetase
MFPELKTTPDDKSSVFSPDEREHGVLRVWKERNVFRRSVEDRDPKNSFSFYEGPPTVNGVPGIHHVFSRSIKDMICRYQTMLGKRVERKAGWDTHGLPVELAIEKQLGFRHKDQIKEYGVDKFNALCKASVYQNIERDGGWKELTERMAYWADMDHPYITCTNDYIESVWWALKKFFDAGKIYKGFKIQPYCPRCETALSSHEVALGYKTAKDPSVFVKFKRKNTPEDEYFLAWTTTPWTLISNVALAVHPEVEYVTVINKRKNSTERLVLAKALLAKLDGEYEIVAEVKGSELEGAEYEPLFTFMPISGKAFFVVLGEYVTTEDGTGIVHTAPAFGEDDYQVAQKYGLPLINAVDKSGNFIPAVTDFVGQFVKDADPNITENLKRRGLLYRKEQIEHTYPFCWRCDSPLLYYARDSWYIRVTDYKDKLASTNQSINWQPPEIRDGRFGNWLEDLKDWGISRERFWGTPLPLWLCAKCDKVQCVGSFDELRSAKHSSGGSIAEVMSAGTFDPHKPYVDEVELTCECGGAMRRVPDVIDVWFDSGSMPFAQFHYPFENKDAFEKAYPAQFISEGIDQTRGWFYTLHAINTFLFDKPPYENVIVNDMLLDKKGQKMSKSKGNILNPFEILSKHGADATRWYLISSSVPWKPKAFNEDDLADVERKFFGTLINTYSFFALYANIDEFKYNAKNRTNGTDRTEVDRWILSELNSLTTECRASFDAYDLTKSARAIQDFVTEQLSNWYVRRNRRRFWKGERNTDKQAAYETLYECLLTISKLMAPLAPFFSDWLYEVLRAGSTDGTHLDSVHLDLYPEADAKLSDIALEARMKSAQTISSLVRQMRERAKIKVRQPLERILIPVANRRQVEELRKVEDVIREEINVKRVEFIQSGDSDVIKLKAKANFKTLGARLGKQMKLAAAKIGTLTQDEIREYQQAGVLNVSVEGESITLERGDIDIIAEDVEGWLVSTDGGITVALDTHLSPELMQEGLAREFVNRIQNLRKDSGFDVTDRIQITLLKASDLVTSAIRGYGAYIREETLATSLNLPSNPGSDDSEGTVIELGDESVSVGLMRVPAGG